MGSHMFGYVPMRSLCFEWPSFCRTLATIGATLADSGAIGATKLDKEIGKNVTMDQAT